MISGQPGIGRYCWSRYSMKKLKFIITVLCIAVALPCITTAQNKTEVALQQKLDAANAALSEAAKDRAKLAASIAKVNAANAIRRTQIDALAKTTAQVQAAATTNDTNAREIAASTQVILSQAAAVVKTSADTVAADAAKLQVAANANWSVLIVQLFLFLTVIAGFIYKGFERRWDRQDADAKNAIINTKIDDSSHTQSAKLDQIHTLVNSNLTASLKDQLDTRRAYLIVLTESIAYKKTAGEVPSSETLGFIDATKIKIAELEAQLADRLVQTTRAESQLKVDKEKYDAKKEK